MHMNGVTIELISYAHVRTRIFFEKLFKFKIK